MKKEVVGDDSQLNIVDEIETLNIGDRFEKESIADLTMDFGDEIDELEDTLNNYLFESDLESSKTKIPD